MQGLLADPILWIETIPFLETRDYVARVMAFSVIYDWRAKRQPHSLWARLRGERDGAKRGFQCSGE
jgi:soluble lytic murein transglycosylase